MSNPLSPVLDGCEDVPMSKIALVTGANQAVVER